MMFFPRKKRKGEILHPAPRLPGFAGPHPFPLFLLFLVLFSPSAFADGGTVLAQQTVGPYRITLFGDPTPLRAGPADLSVLVQDAKTLAPVLNQRVEITVSAPAVTDPKAEAWVPPCCSMKKSVTTAEATHAAAQNKLLSAANLVLPASGPHELTVALRPANAPAAEPTLLTARVEIAPPTPPASAYWPYLALPPFLIGGFVLHQRLRRRDDHRA